MADTEALLKIVTDAYPKLSELDAAKTNLASYIETAEKYRKLAEAEKVKVDNIMRDLQLFSLNFVKTYLGVEELPSPPEDTPSPPTE